jgi:DNA polymerase III epsilon subunit-like protein
VNKLIVFDYETSGFPEHGAAPINFAAAILDPTKGMAITDTFERFMLLEGDDTWSEEARKKAHHITREQLLEKGIPRAQMYIEFQEWMRSHGIRPAPEVEMWDRVHLAGHNIDTFDCDILKSEKGMGREMYRRWFHYRTVDTMKMAFNLDVCYWMAGNGHVFEKEGFPSVELGAIKRFYGIYGKNTAHTAIGDVLDTASVLQKMVATGSGGLKMLLLTKKFRELEASGMSDEELGAAARKLFGRKKAQVAQ